MKKGRKMRPYPRFGGDKGIIRSYDKCRSDRGIRIQTKCTRKGFNAAHQVCFANLRTLRGKPRGVLTRVISTKTKDTLCGVLCFGGEIAT